MTTELLESQVATHHTTSHLKLNEAATTVFFHGQTMSRLHYCPSLPSHCKKNPKKQAPHGEESEWKTTHRMRMFKLSVFITRSAYPIN